MSRAATLPKAERSHCNDRKLNRTLRQLMARLMQVHQETHPRRLAQKFGVSREYVYKVWTDIPADEQAEIEHAIQALRKGVTSCE
jgi:hypothetical protein